jgi:hypothetical protein
MSTTKTQVVTLRRGDTKTSDILKQANCSNPDPAALDALHRLYDERPELWQQIGDLAKATADSIAEGITSNGLYQEAIKRRATAMRDDLDYATAPALERSIIDMAVACWLRLEGVEHAYSRIFNASTITHSSAEYWERRLNHAQGRFRRACETLARVRRLGRPAALQVNIGGQQINLATHHPLTSLDDNMSSSG